MASSRRLQTDVKHLPEVGDGLAKLLARLGIHRCVDLLFFFPRTYEEPACLQTASAFQDKAKVAFVGTIAELDERVTQTGKHMLGAQVTADGGSSVRLLWFNQAFRRKELHVGMRLLATGSIRSTGLNWEMVQPSVKPLVDEEIEVSPHPMPIYPLTDGIKQALMRSIMRSALPNLIEHTEEALPPDVRQRLDVPDIREALTGIHFPKSLDEAARALRRFKLQELLVLQLAIAIQRREREKTGEALACEPTGKIHARILNRLPYDLTADQATSIEQIGRDMARRLPMNRLLQGDVGSGKTLVAQYAMLLCVAHGYQAALMAPTEVLARQHALTLERSLASSRVRVGLLTGSLPAGERSEMLNRLKAGEVDLLVGTQALLSGDVEFHQLALVIVDEQHKFGVEQRAKLRSGHTQPHYLVLSATPIPRTIALTAFGDLDISTIRTKPPGRASVHTYTATTDNINSWWKFVDGKINQGRQAFVIAPRIAEAENSDAVGAEAVFHELANGPFAHRRLGLLHGRLTSSEKEAVLSQFVAGSLDILVATTVIEVGIDVPNATVMSILDADRLGLSQLHQLRGRVARGAHPGFVCAIASSNSAHADNKRLKAFESSDDGFELAEMDLKMRGAGSLLGTTQSGVGALLVSDLTTDSELVEEAREEARAILTKDPELSDPQLARLLRQTLSRYGKSLQLGDVG